MQAFLSIANPYERHPGITPYLTHSVQSAARFFRTPSEDDYVSFVAGRQPGCLKSLAGHQICS